LLIISTTSAPVQEEKPPFVVGEIVNQVTEIVSNIGSYVAESTAEIREQTRAVIETPLGRVATKTVQTGGLLTGLFVALSQIFMTPLSFGELILVPVRLWLLLISLLGLKKRAKPWGTVYDSITKQPLDPAYVIAKDKDGKIIADSITDLDGRYGFLLQPGTYTLEANKTNYSFPSKKLSGRFFDELYDDLYFGVPFTTSSTGEVVVKNIPLDPVKFDWNEFAKREKKLMRFYSAKEVRKQKIFLFLFSMGFIFSTIALFAAPEPYNVIFFSTYVLMLLLRQFVVKRKRSGEVVEQKTGDPLSFGIIRVHSDTFDREVMHRPLDRFGRYYMLVPPGDYIVTAERKNDDESYSNVYTSRPFNTKDGVINWKIEV